MDDTESLSQIENLRKKLKIAKIKIEKKSKSYGQYLKRHVYTPNYHIRDKKREEWRDAFDEEINILLQTHKLP